MLDLDDVVGTIGGFADLTADRFRRSQTVYGQLVGSWLRQGFDVIAHGPFFERDEVDALLSAVPEGIEPQRVLLLATYEVALERVVAESERALSKDSEVLRRAYDRFESLLPMMLQSQWTFDTTTTSWRQIVDAVAAELLRLGH